MELARASSIHRLLSLSTETFLPLLASLTCHQSPAQLKHLFLSVPLSYHLIQESTLCILVVKKAWYQTKQLWSDYEPSPDPFARLCYTQPQRDAASLFLNSHKIFYVISWVKHGPLKRSLYLGSRQAFLVPCVRLSAAPTEPGFTASSLCQAGTRATPAPLPGSPTFCSTMGHGPGDKAPPLHC